MNYGDIRTQFQSILNRSDCSNTLADTFLNQAMLRASRDARVSQQEDFATATVGSPWLGFPVPSDLRQVISFSADGKPMSHRTLDKYLNLTYNSPDTGTPLYYTRVKDYYQFWPTPATDTVLNLYYYGAFEDFANDNDETELSAISWDLLVYGALSYAADHFIDERAEAFENRYMQILDSVQTTSQTEDGQGEMQPAYSLGEDY